MLEPGEIGGWVDRAGPGLILFARQWCQTPEDVVQEAFVALARQRQTPADLTAWLYRVVRNGAINAGVAETRRRRREAEAVAHADLWFEPTSMESGEALDSTSAASALQALPDDERAVIVAHLWGGLRFDQIADLLGTTRSTAHRRYQAGLARLRDRLGVPMP